MEDSGWRKTPDHTGLPPSSILDPPSSFYPSRYTPGVRRLLRILFRAATIVSAVLCAAAAAGWVRSYWRGEVVRWERAGREGSVTRHDGWWVDSAAGSVAVGHSAYRRPLRRRDVDSPWEREYRSSEHPRPPDARYDSLASENPRTIMGAQYARWRVGVVIDAASRLLTPHAEYDGWMLILPYWMPTAALALLPAVAAVREVAGRRRRAAAGLCPACGYDCRVTSAGGRCPECGTVQGGGATDER